MTYRNTLIERSRNFEWENAEPAVLDYLQLRNRQCLQAWHQRRVKHALKAAAQAARSAEAARHV
jgi:hypothetical protein